MAGGKRRHETDEAEEVFVRGGGDLLTPLEKRQIAHKAAADFDQEVQNKSKRSKHAKKEVTTHLTLGASQQDARSSTWSIFRCNRLEAVQLHGICLTLG